MNDDNEKYEEGSEGDTVKKVLIKLDGSYGLRNRADLTVITKDTVEGEKEETFEFPSVLIDMNMLNGAMRAGFIKGYKIVQREVPPMIEVEE